MCFYRFSLAFRQMLFPVAGFWQGEGCVKVMILLNKSSRRTKDIFKVGLGLGSTPTIKVTVQIQYNPSFRHYSWNKRDI